MKTHECLRHHIGGAKELVPKKPLIIPLLRRQEVRRRSGTEKTIESLASTITDTKAKDQYAKNQNLLMNKASAEQLYLQC